ncbi:hypothetical protein BC834DRAFT_989358 [Gloeopeniophorella convolvens]|nr:hypothetical protein BC834DRAFT_989358 [Gloeopeniophorella convolvens]
MAMPHPTRIRAKGRPFFCVWIKLWGDDVSGNRSKQWNKHWNWYLAHAGIPKQLLNQEYFVRFVSTSPHAGILEQGAGICEQIRATKDGYVAFDCHLGEEVMFSLGVSTLPADNPMQSELASHIGLKGNCFCHRCNVGGTQEEKTTAEGFHVLFMPGSQRSAKTTRQEVLAQVQDVTRGQDVEDRQRKTGVKDALAQKFIQRVTQERIQLSKDSQLSSQELEERIDMWATSQRDVMNPFLEEPGLDVNLDTPVEPLHTVLLGVIKYIWAATCNHLASTKALDVFQARLTSLSIRGLNMPPLRASYLIQYRGALIGCQFKQLAQVMPFAIHGLVNEDLFKIWLAAGRMTATMWYPEIDNVDLYCKNLEQQISNFLDLVATTDPERIKAKPKFHILMHTPEDVRRFGPPILSSTEVFECYNAVFRFCSILSNHQAPSCDISQKFSSLARFKHITSGGWWQDSTTEKWVRAGPDLRQIFLKTTWIQEYLGWLNPMLTVPDNICYKLICPGRPGNIQLCRVDERETFWSETKASSAIALLAKQPTCPNDTQVLRGQRVTSQTQDAVKLGDFVIAGTVHAPGISRDGARCHTTATGTYLVMERFTLGGLHAEYQMPTLHRPIEPQIVLFHAEQLHMPVNIQHDCLRGQCSTASSVHEIQERERTERHILTISHVDDAHFILNMQALHNAHVLARVLPSDVTQAKPVVEDRVQHHRDIASKLQVITSDRQELNRAKRQLTKTMHTEQCSGVKRSTEDAGIDTVVRMGPSMHPHQTIGTTAAPFVLPGSDTMPSSSQL